MGEVRPANVGDDSSMVKRVDSRFRSPFRTYAEKLTYSGTCISGGVRLG